MGPRLTDARRSRSPWRSFRGRVINPEAHTPGGSNLGSRSRLLLDAARRPAQIEDQRCEQRRLSMYWQRWSDRLKGELGLATEPVAVTFAGAPAPGGPVLHGKASVCQALKRASEGECITISVETCGCPGGLVSLGLGQLPPDGKERLADVLVEKERFSCPPAPPPRGRGIVPVPAGVASQVVFSPLAPAALQPDLLAFIGPPGP